MKRMGIKDIYFLKDEHSKTLSITKEIEEIVLKYGNAKVNNYYLISTEKGVLYHTKHGWERVIVEKRRRPNLLPDRSIIEEAKREVKKHDARTRAD